MAAVPHPKRYRLEDNLSAYEERIFLTGTQALVRMLLRNLVQNAVRHTRGQVRVDIAASQLTVSDDGGGLPAHVRERLSAPQSSRQLPEDGLGLFIVRLICERLGWRYRVLDRTPLGTVFELDWGTEPPTEGL